MIKLDTKIWRRHKRGKWMPMNIETSAISRARNGGD